MTDREQKEIRTAFRQAVNLAPKELERWLVTEESQSVGWTREGDDEAVGHQSGRRIVDLRCRKAAELSDDDYAHIRKVVATCTAISSSGAKATSRRRAGASRS
jgi:Protein of unknown function (DUF3140)